MALDSIFYLRLFVVIVDYIISGIMLIKTIQIREAVSKKKYFMGLTLFFISHSTCRLFFMLDDYIYEETGIQIFTIIASFLGVLSLVFIVIVIETVIFKKSKYIFSMIGVVGLFFDALDIIFLTNNRYWVQISINLCLAVFIVLIYISHIFLSTGIIRRHFTVFTIGIILFSLGELGSINQVYSLFPLALILAPIFMLAGLIVLFYSVVRYYKE